LDGVYAYRFASISMSRDGATSASGYVHQATILTCLLNAIKGRLFSQSDDLLPGANRSVISYVCAKPVLRAMKVYWKECTAE